MEEGNSLIQIEEDRNKQFVSLIEENLKSLAGLSTSKPNIYTVPKRLRSSNEAAYSPRVVSIGPIHHETKKPALLKMESYKLFFFDQFLKRTSNLTLTDYANMMREKEEKLRSCYSDSETLKGLNSEEFLKIILVDATFIIEFLLRSSRSPYRIGTSSDFDYIFSSYSTWLLPDLQYDLLLLENQIPYFILVELYDLIKYNLSPNNLQEVKSLKELIYLFLKDILWGIDKTKWEGINNIQHLLDFVWKWYISTATPQQKQLLSEKEEVESKLEGKHEIQHLLDCVWGLCHQQQKDLENDEEVENCLNIPNTTLLNECGVIFKENKTKNLFDINQKDLENDEEVENCLNIPKTTLLNECGVIFRENKKKNLFDITFDKKKGVLLMPRLRIDDYTDMILRNLIAYEQCNCDTKTLSSYLSFMDSLVNTEEDVQFLVRKGIFENLLGDEKEVASLINKLGDGLVTDEDNYFAQIGAQLDKYYKKSWHKWKAHLKHNYFKNPWTIIAVVASAFLLILTTIQTIYSVLQANKD